MDKDSFEIMIHAYNYCVSRSLSWDDDYDRASLIIIAVMHDIYKPSLALCMTFTNPH